MRLDFINEFGGFPESRGGWGYDSEIAYQAKIKGKRILITDKYTIRHTGDSARSDTTLGKEFDKWKELQQIYKSRYENFSILVSRLWSPFQAEPEVPVLPERPVIDPSESLHISHAQTGKDEKMQGYQELVRGIFSRMSKGVIDQFHELYYGLRVFGGTWFNTLWLGTPTRKCPLDLWVYQEIIHRIRPDVIIETGTSVGGSAHFLASICDLLGHGKVVTIDTKQIGDRPQHQRIVYLSGSSTSSIIVENVRGQIRDKDKVMVILDSDHHKEHVLREMEIYSEFVSNGSFLIVEGTNINGNPVLQDFGPGPMEAVEEFLKQHTIFHQDRTKEKFLLSFNPKGYLLKSG